ncbi:MAG TPA: MarR family transcriptional regulator [Planctomycetota bacterium]|nr:MarR family transcriptional regulator [Planctomycetota bacterium]
MLSVTTYRTFIRAGAEQDHSAGDMSIPAEFTELQGQYLAFIHAVTKIHRRAPAEAPPSVHRMVVELERRGLIRREPRKPRSIEILIAADRLRALK